MAYHSVTDVLMSSELCILSALMKHVSVFLMHDRGQTLWLCSDHRRVQRLQGVAFVTQPSTAALCPTFTANADAPSATNQGIN